MQNTRPGVADGACLCREFSAGLLVHAIDGMEPEHQDVSIGKPPGLTICIVLESARCIALSSGTPYELIRHFQQGRPLRKIIVAVEWDWLAQRHAYCSASLQCINALRAQSTGYWEWPASPQLVGLGEQLLASTKAPPLIRHFQVESRALDILSDALLELDQQQAQPVTRGIERAHAYIERNLQNISSLEELARHVGMSVSSLQRQFKQTYRQTVVNYLRRRKLEMARAALSREDMSIGEAAYIAGYSHTSNFVTAYKRQFGHTPGAVGQHPTA